VDTLTNLDFGQKVRVICIVTQHFMHTDFILGDNTMLLWAVLPTFRSYVLPCLWGVGEVSQRLFARH